MGGSASAPVVRTVSSGGDGREGELSDKKHPHTDDQNSLPLTEEGEGHEKEDEDEDLEPPDPVAAAYSSFSKCIDPGRVRQLQKTYVQQVMLEGEARKKTETQRDSDVAMLEMGMAMRGNDTISCIRLPNQRCSSLGLMLFLQELAGIRSLTALDLSCNCLGPVAPPCEEDDEDSSSHSFGPAACAALASVLSSKGVAVETLELDSCRLGPAEGGALAAALETSSSLKKLLLGDNDLRSAGALVIGAALNSTPALTCLNLSGNGIDHRGVQSLSNFLSRAGRVRLKTLSLERNSIGAEGCLVLAAGLRANSSLTSLSLWGNGIGSQGVQHVASVLLTNTSLTELNVGDNKIDDQGVRSLFEALKQNKTLSSLLLWYNSIGKEGMDSVASALSTNITLQKLNMHGMRGFSTPHALRLATSLRTNSRLHVLDIGGCDLSEDAKAGFLSLLSKSKVSKLNTLFGIVLTDFLELLELPPNSTSSNSSILTALQHRRRKAAGAAENESKQHHPPPLPRALSLDLEAVVKGI